MPCLQESSTGVREHQCEFRWHAVNEPIVVISFNESKIVVISFSVVWDVPTLLAFLAMSPASFTAINAAMGGGHTSDRIRAIFTFAPFGRMTYIERARKHWLSVAFWFGRFADKFRLIIVATRSSCRKATAS